MARGGGKRGGVEAGRGKKGSISSFYHAEEVQEGRGDERKKRKSVP